MSDFLLQLSENRRARRLIESLGLPIPMPTRLRRATGAWEERPLADRAIAAGGAPGATLLGAVAKTLVRAGAEPHVAGDAGLFRELGEAWGRPPHLLDTGALPEGTRFAALVFDAGGISDPAGLRALYDFFHPLAGAIEPGGRVVVLGRPPQAQASAAAAAAQAALEGFVRSLAKEIGRKGATANLLVVGAGAESRVEPVLRFLLSDRSAFITAQPLAISAQVPAAGEPPLVRPLEGKVALVTGAARGIGEATARRLAAEGAHVVCLDRPADDGPLAAIARELHGSTLAIDITDAGAPAAIAAHLRDRHGGVDVVVHNAGVTRDKTLARMTAELWDQAIDINLAAVARIDDALLAGVLRGGGRIVCLSSVAGIAGNLGQTNYAASKAGLVGYVDKRAAELAARGVTVNAVAPGFIETRLTAAIPAMIREAGRRLSALGQGGLPVDVAETITFLVTPGAAGITGATLRVCGGALIGA